MKSIGVFMFLFLWKQKLYDQYLEEVKEDVEGVEGGVGDCAGAQHQHVQARPQLK